MSTASAAIVVKNLTVGWGDFILMKDISFEVPRGDTFCILGGSGCGKSSLLRHLIGLERPKGGTIDIAGLGAPDTLETFDRPSFGVMFQSGALFGSLTLLENVSLPLRKWTRLPTDAVRAVAAARLRLVGLGGFENHLPAEISGGMKKRAGIARALALESSLLFLDEPSAGLDPISADELDELILTLNGVLGVTIVLVTHELQSIFKVARTCIMLDKQAQGIIVRGDPRELRDRSPDPRVKGFFNRQSRIA
jgi:phospholipid/cholesterol/gamma-HCH transport system ATP-binding protein